MGAKKRRLKMRTFFLCAKMTIIEVFRFCVYTKVCANNVLTPVSVNTFGS
jgi:hypothetical protein